MGKRRELWESAGSDQGEENRKKQGKMMGKRRELWESAGSDQGEENRKKQGKKRIKKGNKRIKITNIVKVVEGRE